MTSAGPHQRATVIGDSTPRFSPQAKFRLDEIRQRWVILAPERLLVPDETALEILHFLDGERSVDMIIDALAKRYNAERETIATDVLAMLQDLVDKNVLRV